MFMDLGGPGSDPKAAFLHQAVVHVVDRDVPGFRCRRRLSGIGVPEPTVGAPLGGFQHRHERRADRTHDRMIFGSYGVAHLAAGTMLARSSRFTLPVETGRPRHLSSYWMQTR